MLRIAQQRHSIAERDEARAQAGIAQPRLTKAIHRPVPPRTAKAWFGGARRGKGEA